MEWPNTSHASTGSYIEDTYAYIKASYNLHTPMDYLALIASIAYVGLLPNIYAPDKITPSKNMLKYADFVQKLDWEDHTRYGASHAHIFFHMVTVFIISLYDPESPVLKRTDRNAWFKKYCMSYYLFSTMFTN